MKKERMVEEKARLETSLSESKKELEAQSSLARGLQAEIKKLNTAVVLRWRWWGWTVMRRTSRQGRSF